MTLQQVNLGYIPPEDRLLLRIALDDKKEFRLWLTRAITRRLLHQLQGGERKSLGVSNPIAAHSIQEFNRDSATAQNDFSSEFNPDATDFPFGPDPLLVIEVALADKAENHELTLKLAPGSALAIELDLDMIQHFVKLLQLALGATDWGLDESPLAPGSMLPTTGMVLH